MDNGTAPWLTYCDDTCSTVSRFEDQRWPLSQFVRADQVRSHKVVQSLLVIVILVILFVDFDVSSVADNDLKKNLENTISQVFQCGNCWPHRYRVSVDGNFVKIELADGAIDDPFIIAVRTLVDSLAARVERLLPMGREGEIFRMFVESQNRTLATVVVTSSDVKVSEGRLLTDVMGIY